MSLYKEDVYETEDPPLPEQIEAKEYFENNEIEQTHIDLHGAQRRFGKCILDPGNADFSDSVATMRLKRGYKASEIFEGDPVEEETFEQKYERVCKEVEELMAQAEKRKATSTQNPEKHEISALRDLLRTISSTTSNEQRGNRETANDQQEQKD